MSVWSELATKLSVTEVDPHFVFDACLCTSFLNNFPLAKGSNGELERISAVELVLAGTLSVPIMQFAGLSSGKVVAGGIPMYKASKAWCELNPECGSYPPIFVPAPWWAVLVDTKCHIYKPGDEVGADVLPHTVYESVFSANCLPWSTQGARLYLEILRKNYLDIGISGLGPVNYVQGNIAVLLEIIDIRFGISLTNFDVESLRDLYLTQLNPINSDMRSYYRMCVIIGGNAMRLRLARRYVRDTPKRYSELLVNGVSNQDVIERVSDDSDLIHALPRLSGETALADAFYAVVGCLSAEVSQLFVDEMLDSLGLGGDTTTK